MKRENKSELSKSKLLSSLVVVLFVTHFCTPASEPLVWEQVPPLGLGPPEINSPDFKTVNKQQPDRCALMSLTGSGHNQTVPDQCPAGSCVAGQLSVDCRMVSVKLTPALDSACVLGKMGSFSLWSCLLQFT